MNKRQTELDRPGIVRRSVRLDQTRPHIERRGEGEDAPRMIVGYAAVFYRADDPGTEYRLWSDTVERIMDGAFDGALKDKDLVRGLTNHDPCWLLGRSDQGTVRLAVDKIGLRYEIDPPDTQAGRDTVALLERGDLDGSSFGFRVSGSKRGKTAWIEEARDGRTLYVREIRDLELVDVGPVTFPAYESTAAGVRSESDAVEARSDFDAWQRVQAAADQVPVELDMDLAIAEAEQLVAV